MNVIAVAPRDDSTRGLVLDELERRLHFVNEVVGAVERPYRDRHIIPLLPIMPPVRRSSSVSLKRSSICW